MTAVGLDKIDSVVASLWAQAGEGTAARMCTMNLVALCAEPSQFASAQKVVEEILPSHPGRAVIVVEGERGGRIEADVMLVCGVADRGRACGECVTLRTPPEARVWLPTAIERLLEPGPRVHLWWLGDLPDEDTLYDRLTDIAHVVSINSEDMDLRDLRTVSRLVRSAHARYALGDLNWHRLRPWQEQLASFFDDPAVLPHLARAHKLALTCANPRGSAIPEPTSTQAGLFAGWFASRVEADTAHARWTAPRELVVPRRGSGSLTITFESRARADVFPGALLGVSLEADGGACFDLVRGEDRHLIERSGSCSSAPIPTTRAPTGEADTARMLRAQLERPMRDVLFERSLDAAAEMIEPLYATRR